MCQHAQSHMLVYRITIVKNRPFWNTIPNNLVKFEGNRLKKTEVSTQHVYKHVQQTTFQRVKSHNSGTSKVKIFQKYAHTQDYNFQ